VAVEVRRLPPRRQLLLEDVMRWFFKPGVDLSMKAEEKMDEQSRLTLPLVDGFFQVTEAMEPNEKCDLHPNLTFWGCWVEWYRGRGKRGIRTKVVTQKTHGRVWVAVYRENYKSGRGSNH